MPTLLRLRLIHATARTPVALFPAVAQGWFLRLAATLDPAWADALHEGSAKRGYTLSVHASLDKPLAEEDTLLEPPLVPNAPVGVRLSLTEDDRARELVERLSHLPLPAVGKIPVTLARYPVWTDMDPDLLFADWTQLLHAPPASRLQVEFLTPTVFLRQGEMILLPETHRMVASWQRAYIHHAPPALLQNPAYAFLHHDLDLSGLRLADYCLHTETRVIKDGKKRGFVGYVVLEWDPKRSTEVQRQQFCAVAGISDFVGTGAKTTLGMGQTRLRLVD